MRLAGKTALVTGAGRGIGKAIALKLAENGATVVFNFSRSADAAEQAASSVPDGRGISMGFDVSDGQAVKAAMEKITKEIGQLTIVVNNAGISRDNLLMRASDDDFNATMNTNLKGVFNVTRAAVRPMMKAKMGSIINISSVIGEMGNAGQSIYAASKAGIIGFTKKVWQKSFPAEISEQIASPLAILPLK